MSSKIYDYDDINTFLPPNQARLSNPQLLALNAKPTTHKLNQSSFRGGALRVPRARVRVERLRAPMSFHSNEPEVDTLGNDYQDYLNHLLGATDEQLLLATNRPMRNNPNRTRQEMIEYLGNHARFMTLHLHRQQLNNAAHAAAQNAAQDAAQNAAQNDILNDEWYDTSLGG